MEFRQVPKEEKTMRERIQTRIEALRKEIETGQAALEKVERQRAYLQETTLRIAGAIQVLEELLAEGQPGCRDEAGPGITQTSFTRDNVCNVQQTKISLDNTTVEAV